MKLFEIFTTKPATLYNLLQWHSYINVLRWRVNPGSLLQLQTVSWDCKITISLKTVDEINKKLRPYCSRSSISKYDLQAMQ